uniref:Uncharacterized protein n=1 Tax=Arundo donax TaxID=35708 RepID=A0A0A9AWX0_ARUDO
MLVYFTGKQLLTDRSLTRLSCKVSCNFTFCLCSCPVHCI